MMALQNVTVIIPAHNRPERLRRLLDYYSRTDIKILVPDSSDQPFFRCREVPGRDISAPSQTTFPAETERGAPDDLHSLRAVLRR